MSDFKVDLSFSGTIPGEQIFVSIMQYAMKHRETMSQENRDRFDKFQIQSMEDWRRFWQAIGLIPKDGE